MGAGLQVVFGAGPVGASTALHLLDLGHRVRMVSRSGRRSVAFVDKLRSEKESRLELLSGDAANPAELRKASAGASHIYHCLNLSYEDWARGLPPIHAALVSAALEADAVLAVAENLYMYSRGQGRIHEDAIQEPHTRKGALQKALHQKLVEAGASRGLRWTAVRASDFYGPGAIQQSVFGTVRFLEPLYAGRKPGILGDPDRMHSYTYVADYGRALATAAQSPAALGKAWIVPNDRTTSTRELAQLFFEAAGRGRGISPIPRPVLALAGIFVPVIRELGEMLYQKEEDYLVDGSSFKATFGFEPTRLEDGVRTTLAWYLQLHQGSGLIASLQGR